ncbi:PREDICTED: uncharacterized serine/threonine-protein kinase SgK494 [Haliaeetus leucocephalus]|uniref:uncharacterized serine/threonine-protein kinase SgK494 n=1 Tax=Haliaeetus leucocephalus TaxID=52644 RepID=UPI00053CBC29|nr:PREDICTED: uncharacterized serine/threonine-protein kinase SgK494 [Haliaeetus leucocephalus]
MPKAGEPPLPGWPLPQLVSLFLPEFPVRPSARQQQLKVPSRGPPTLLPGSRCILPGFPTVLPGRQRIPAPAAPSALTGPLRTSYRGPCTPYRGPCTPYRVCTYCSTGDLHALWRAAGHFAEATVRLFAAELVLVLVYLHDLGIMHRDVKMENILLDERGHLKLTDFGLSRHLRWGERAHTICGTLQYMAPEVLSGGPYGHTADWWSLGVLLFALASGEFPVAPAGDHVAMLERVKESSYEIPPAFSPALARLLAELLCHNPLRRLRYLHHFQGHPFFRGVAFDADLLQKDPVAMAVAPRPLEQPPPDPATFADFDCDLVVSPGRPWPG